MRFVRDETIEIHLVLSKQEARWLKELVQNPLTEDKDIASNNIRKSFWDALEAAGVKSTG